MNNVLLIVVQRESPVCQSQHAIAVRTLSGEQRSATRRACRCNAECLPKQNALGRKALQIRCRHRMAIRLEISAGIVGMNVNDIWKDLRYGRRLFTQRAELRRDAYAGDTLQKLAPRSSRLYFFLHDSCSPILPLETRHVGCCLQHQTSPRTRPPCCRREGRAPPLAYASLGRCVYPRGAPNLT